MTYAVGCTVGAYEIGEKLAGSGPDEWFRARVSGPTQVAEDVLRVVCRAANPTVIEASQRDVARLKALTHPNVARVREGFCHEGSFLLVEEFVDGRTLEELLASGPVPVDQALHYARQILSGLAAAHRKGIAHGAIEAGRVKITKHDQVSLTGFRVAADYGGAKAVQAEAYQAPERFHAPHQSADRAADVYSCGMLLWELFTGRKPFQAAHSFGWRMHHQETKVLPPARLCDGLPPDVDQAVVRALEKKPEDRFSSADEFLQAFEGKPARQGAPKAVVATAAALVLLLAGGGMAGARRYFAPPPAPPAMPPVEIRQAPVVAGLYAVPLPVEKEVKQPAASRLEPPRSIRATPAWTMPVASKPPDEVRAREERPPAPAVSNIEEKAMPVERPPLKARIYGALTDEPPPAARVQAAPVADEAGAVSHSVRTPFAAAAVEPAAAAAPADPPGDLAAPQHTWVVTPLPTPKAKDGGFLRGLGRRINPFRKREAPASNAGPKP